MSNVTMFHVTGKSKKAVKLQVPAAKAAELLSSEAKLKQFKEGLTVRVRRGEVMHKYWNVERQKQRSA